MNVYVRRTWAPSNECSHCPWIGVAGCPGACGPGGPSTSDNVLRMSRERIQVIERATDIVDILAEGSATLTEVAARTGLAKGTAFRILSSLSYGDRVVKDPMTTRYMLGPGTWRLAQAAMDGLGSLALIARPVLSDLWKATSETITLSMRMGLERVCIEELRSPFPFLHTMGVGSRIPLHFGASGRVILAFTEPRQRERILDTLSYERLTPATITDRQRLFEELALVRERGWAVSTGERIPGAVGISVPVQGPSDLVMSLSLLGPAERLTADVRDGFILKMQAAAQAIESRVEAAADRERSSS